MHSPTAGCWGGAVSYERGTPVASEPYTLNLARDRGVGGWGAEGGRGRQRETEGGRGKQGCWMSHLVEILPSPRHLWGSGFYRLGVKGALGLGELSKVRAP